MKKQLIMSALVALAVVTPAFADTASDNTNLDQKACSNVFSLVNVNVSAFSPSMSAADISIKGNKVTSPSKDTKAEVPVSDKSSQKEPAQEITQVRELNNVSLTNTDSTSFFRLDLLGIIKIKLF